MKRMLTVLGGMLAGVAMSISAAHADKLKVGFVYLTNPGDHGWTYAHEVGRQQLQDHFGSKIETTLCRERARRPGCGARYQRAGCTRQQGDFHYFFWLYGTNPESRKENPDVMFDHITGYKRAPNMATGNIRFYEGRYVQGVVAGLTTKSNTIGYLGAFPIPEVIQGINAFCTRSAFGEQRCQHQGCMGK